MPEGFEDLASADDVARALAELKGMKMRTYNAQTARLAQLMGTVPTTVQATEIPQAFTSGIIDTMFTSAPMPCTKRRISAKSLGELKVP